MATRVYPIDWRDLFAALEPYLNGEGGVVRIRYSGKASAHSAFLETLKSEYECKDGNRNWRSLRIDHEVYSTRYLSDVRDEFIRKMKVELPEADAAPAGAATMHVGTENKAGGSLEQEISDVTQINYFDGDNPVLMSRNRAKWVAALCTQLKEFLDGGYMMIVVNHGPADDQDQFWRHLWEGNLDALVEDGLLLVHMVDVSDENAGLSPLAPEPYLELDLPTVLSADEQKHAVEDLTGIMIRTFRDMSMEAARERADMLVETHVRDIARLHREFSAFLMRRARGAG